ncbi:protein N-terminal asparagine amidohydrolase isoform X2 [Actinidia eriantha]|uniref:protein N-terminal asparagine amidohydrolase isoform X2 n=1 Tax=Actinidia eriantha TaxID=165200 RepID=UPI00258CD146|nr:protein N-terminal asparagine amidohydrolase isoform X2 [Actinidia eriantha]
MIYVGGVPFHTDSESLSQGSDMLLALMEHPFLVSASSSCKAIPERKFRISEESGSERLRQSKCVYIFQREYATVDPAAVDLVGTDEATTCVGLAIRNRASGMTSVAHMDSPKVVDIGLTQMLALVVNQDSKVHLIGGFDDASPQDANFGPRSEIKEKSEGHSFPLCAKIVETLQKSRERFHLQTLHVLQHNTSRDSQGNACPIFHGFLVETSTGSVIPASFDRTSRCPDEIVRRIRLTSCFEDPSWKGKLLETYDTQTDRFVIAPCSWTENLVHFALTVRQLSDSEILLSCSTSPFAEGPDFVDNERRLFDYLIQYPDWRQTFPMKQPRVFERTVNGTWTRQGVTSAPKLSRR